MKLTIPFSYTENVISATKNPGVAAAASVLLAATSK